MNIIVIGCGKIGGTILANLVEEGHDVVALDNNPDVIAIATLHARTESLFYFLLAFSHCISGILRGAGKSAVPMYVMLASWCALRITYITIAVRLIPVVQTIYWAYPLTWSVSSIIFLIYYLKVDWVHGFEK